MIRRSGMTLVEILAVVVILGILATALTVGISAKMGKAKHEIAKTQIAEIVGEIQTFQMETKKLPSTDTGLTVLSEDPKQPYYLKPSEANDPWGRPYLYLVPGPDGSPFEVLTYGADGQPGGTGEDADVSSSALSK